MPLHESEARFPEVRSMVEAAKQFVRGEIDEIAFYGTAAECAFWAKTFKAHPGILDLAQTWASLGDRAWNEWGHHENPLTAEELKQELLKYLGEIETQGDSA